MKNNILNHISFILDGNKRWAKKNKVTNLQGYRKGIEKIYEVINYCYKNKIKFLSLYLLSTENINRKNNKSFFNLANNEFNTFISKINEIGNIKLNIIGERKNLPKNIVELLNKLKNNDKNNDASLVINLAFNYGFHYEIKNVISDVINYSLKNNKRINDIDINNFFYLKKQPDPDVLIRTGGYNRLSNFILKNLSYTEIYFVKTLWPDLGINEIDKIITNFKKINRNYGL